MVVLGRDSVQHVWMMLGRDSVQHVCMMLGRDSVQHETFLHVCSSLLLHVYNKILVCKWRTGDVTRTRISGDFKPTTQYTHQPSLQDLLTCCHSEHSPFTDHS